MQTVVSGIRPTGKLHMGNYFGAIKNAVKMQHEYNCYFFVADYHSLTTHPNPADLHNNIHHVVTTYLACGLDPEKATIYVQSDLPETAELYLLLNMIAYKGELERCTSFKEKVRKQEDNVNAGLLTYPVLMAADILIHKAHKVPVGKDQEQHLEMTRNFAKRFNHMYKGEILPEPIAFSYSDKLVKVPGLDGTGKMGKSEGEKNALFLTDDDKTITKKVKKAVTDAGPTEMNQEKPEIIQNLFDLLGLVSEQETIQQFEEAYNNCTIRYGDLKAQLAEDIIKFVTPIRERINEIASDEHFLKTVIKGGAEKAQENGKKTVDEVRAAVGIRKFY